MRCLLITLLLVILPANAVIETYEFSDPSLQSRYASLSQELRCPKCQNQNIADSNAPISRDLRAILYAQLEAGATDDEILEYMVARYGEFVRYRPAVDSATAWLWYGPLVLLLAAVLSVFWVVRGRASGSADPQANAEALATLRERLAERDKADTRD